MLLPEDHLLLRPVQRLPVADPALEGATDAIGELGMAAQQLAQDGHRAQPEARSIGTISLSQTAASGSGRRRVRGWRFCEGARGSASRRAPVLVLKPALAAAMVRLWFRRRCIYNVAC